MAHQDSRADHQHQPLLHRRYTHTECSRKAQSILRDKQHLGLRWLERDSGYNLYLEILLLHQLSLSLKSRGFHKSLQVTVSVKIKQKTDSTKGFGVDYTVYIMVLLPCTSIYSTSGFVK
ncbi:hypothetical protein AMECASPLE_013582 [Ameca splendens]|uniref:Uncharacterized protein n=1 Tax=Ameca splendens TaxID=208324 RepID=A0ABV0Y1A0_9TELE